MFVYKVTNLINGKFYIGKQESKRSDYLGSGVLLKKAIKKYGRDNFKKEILEYCETKEELNVREIYWIEKLNAIEEGYNIATGGEGGNLIQFRKKTLKGKTYEEIYGKSKALELKKLKSKQSKGSKNPMYGKKLNKEHLDKIIKANKNRKYFFSKNHKEKISKALTGRKVSEFTKKKMSDARVNKNKKGIELLIYDKNMFFLKKCMSIKEASIFTNIHYRSIQRHIYKNKELSDYKILISNEKRKN